MRSGMVGSRSRKGSLRIEELDPGLLRPHLADWKVGQNEVVNAFWEWWRKASDDARIRCPWYWESSDGKMPTVLKRRDDGSVILRAYHLPSGGFAVVWVLSAGVLEEVRQYLVHVGRG